MLRQPATTLEFLDCLAKRIDRLRSEEKPGRAVQYGLSRATYAIGDDGSSCGLGLDWNDSEVFNPREQEGLCTGIGPSHVFARESAAASDDEPTSHLCAGRLRKVKPLVLDVGACEEVVIAFAANAVGEERNIYRRMHYNGVASVDAADSLCDETAIGDELIYRLGAF